MRSPAMPELLRGPLLVFVAAAAGLSATLAGLTPEAPPASGPGTWPMARALAGAVHDLLPQWVHGPGILAMAAAAAFLFRAAHAWTGNRIVSVLAGLLLAFHPATAGLHGQGVAAAQGLSLALVLGALSLREGAWEALRRGRSPLRAELLAVLVAASAATAGPAFLAFPVLAALTDLVFHGREAAASRREILPRLVLHALVVLGVWHLLPGGRADAVGPEESLDRLALILGPLPPGLRPWAGAILASGGASALLLVARRSADPPRWVLLGTALAFGAFLAGEIPLLAGLCSRSRGLDAAALVGFALFLPMLGWRLLLVRSPEPVPETPPPPPHPPRAIPVPPWPELARLDAALAAGEGGTFRTPAVRALVEAAVVAAVESGVSGALRAAAGRTGGGMLPSALEREWLARSRDRALARVASELPRREEEERLFLAAVRPRLGPGARVVEMGAAHGRFAALMLPWAGEIVVLHDRREALLRLREDLGDAPGLRPVLAARGRLDTLAPGCADLVVSASLLLEADTASAARALAAIRACLRPGGAAVLLFLDLESREAARRLEAEMAAEAPARQPYLTRDAVALLARIAGLELAGVSGGPEDPHRLAILVPGAPA